LRGNKYVKWGHLEVSQEYQDTFVFPNGVIPHVYGVARKRLHLQKDCWTKNRKSLGKNGCIVGKIELKRKQSVNMFGWKN